MLVQNLSAIMGPNGSGKSNVIDAMLFVFGRRAKQVCLEVLRCALLCISCMFTPSCWSLSCFVAFESSSAMTTYAQSVSLGPRLNSQEDCCGAGEHGTLAPYCSAITAALSLYTDCLGVPAAAPEQGIRANSQLHTPPECAASSGLRVL